MSRNIQRKGSFTPRVFQNKNITKSTNLLMIVNFARRHHNLYKAEEVLRGEYRSLNSITVDRINASYLMTSIIDTPKIIARQQIVQQLNVIDKQKIQICWLMAAIYNGESNFKVTNRIIKETRQNQYNSLERLGKMIDTPAFYGYDSSIKKGI